MAYESVESMGSEGQNSLKPWHSAIWMCVVYLQERMLGSSF